MADLSAYLSSVSTFDYLSLLPFIAVVAASFILAKIAYFIIQKFAKQLAGQTKTILDDLLLHAIEGPLTYGIVIIGLYAGATISALSTIPLVVGIFQILLLIWLSVTVYRVVCAFIHWYVLEVAPRHKLSLHDVEPLLKRVAGLIIFILAAITILGTVGVEVGPLIASLGIAGLAVALALQDTLGNFFGGVSISVDRPLRHGDYIELPDNKLSGWVEKVGWRSTQLRTGQSNIIVIPNLKLAQSTIINYSMPDKEIAVVVPVSASYDSDLEEVEKITLQVADHIQKTHSGAVQGFKPVLRYTSFADSGINFSVVLRATEFVESGTMAHQFIKALHARFAKEGIAIPCPTRSVHIEKSGLPKSTKFANKLCAPWNYRNSKLMKKGKK